MSQLTNNLKLYLQQVSKNRQLLLELFESNSRFSNQLKILHKKQFCKSNQSTIIYEYFKYLTSNKFKPKASQKLQLYFKKHDLTQILCDFNDWLTLSQNIDLIIAKSQQQLQNPIFVFIRSLFNEKQQNLKQTQKNGNRSKNNKQTGKIETKAHLKISNNSKQAIIKNKQVEVQSQQTKFTDSIKKQFCKKTQAFIQKHSLNQIKFNLKTLYRQKYIQFNNKQDQTCDFEDNKLLFDNIPEEAVECMNEGSQRQKNRVLLAYMLVQPHNVSKYSFILNRINHSRLFRQQY